MMRVRIAAWAVASGLALLVAACSSDDSGGGSGDDGDGSYPSSGCPAEPCTVGARCLQEPTPACNGEWYCWTDQNWHCAPQDGGGPAGFPDGGLGGGDGASDGASDAATTPEATMTEGGGG
jgi:hypothetical protein